MRCPDGERITCSILEVPLGSRKSDYLSIQGHLKGQYVSDKNPGGAQVTLPYIIIIIIPCISHGRPHWYA